VRHYTFPLFYILDNCVTKHPSDIIRSLFKYNDPADHVLGPDPYLILDIDADRTRCCGQTQKLQTCENPISSDIRREAHLLLSNLSAMDPSLDCLNVHLQDLSEMLLCWTHDWQSEDLISKWCQALTGFNTTTSSQNASASCDRSQTNATHDVGNQADNARSGAEIANQYQLQGASQSSTADMTRSNLPWEPDMTNASTLGRAISQDGHPSHGNPQPDPSHADAAGTKTKATQKDLIQKLYQEKVTAHQKAMAQAAATEQEVNALADMLGGTTIAGSSGRRPNETTQTSASRDQDGIKGNCGICLEELRNRSGLEMSTMSSGLGG
ncbi:MAG: hypothetical protein Q9169_006211, partial [Polycauliona sp. 2 TL-2023]